MLAFLMVSYDRQITRIFRSEISTRRTSQNPKTSNNWKKHKIKRKQYNIMRELLGRSDRNRNVMLIIFKYNYPNAWNVCL